MAATSAEDVLYVTGSGSCLPCPAGHSCEDYSSALSCAAGYISALGDKICTKCDSGTVPNVDQDNCDPCPSGYSCGDPS